MTSYEPFATSVPNALLADQGDRRTPVVGPDKPPPTPPGGAFGTPESPGQIAYPPGTIKNRLAGPARPST